MSMTLFGLDTMALEDPNTTQTWVDERRRKHAATHNGRRCQHPGGCKRFSTVQDGDRCKNHAKLEDVLWLLRWGANPLDVIRRVNLTAAGVDVLLRRNGYPELAAPFAAEAWKRYNGGRTCG